MRYTGSICGFCGNDAAEGCNVSLHPGNVLRERAREAEETRLALPFEAFAIAATPCGDCYRFVGHADWCLTKWVVCMCTSSLPDHHYGEHARCSVAKVKRQNDPWLPLVADRATTSVGAWDHYREALL